MKCRIIVFHSSKLLFYTDFGIQFFLNFTFDGLLWTFTSFNFSTWKLSSILKISISSLGSKNLILVDDQCRHYIYPFQNHDSFPQLYFLLYIYLLMHLLYYVNVPISLLLSYKVANIIVLINFIEANIFQKFINSIKSLRHPDNHTIPAPS